MATSPSPLKGLALVQPGRGIKVNYLYYWSDAFRKERSRADSCANSLRPL